METEVKIRINEEDLKKITSLLGNPYFISQENIVYKLPQGYLRVRFEHEKTILTCKGERINDKFGSRREIEVCSEPNILEIIEMLGLERVSIYSKKRANYSLNDCIISLDIIQNDCYIEVEGNEDGILLALKKLGLDKKEVERREYWELYDQKNNCRRS